MSGLSIKIDEKDFAEVRAALNKLSGDELVKAQVRGINKTSDGVKTDGVKMMTDYYDLTASAIRESWKISKSSFKNPTAVVSTKGTFIRLIQYGAKQVSAGVSVKVLKSSGRKVIQHAYIGRIRSDQKTDQVYRRKYHDEAHGKTSRMTRMAGKVGFIWSEKQNRYIPAKWLPEDYRLPVRALYGPRIQDYISDPVHMALLSKMAGDRLIKNMQHEVEYLLSLAKKG